MITGSCKYIQVSRAGYRLAQLQVPDLLPEQELRKLLHELTCLLQATGHFDTLTWLIPGSRDMFENQPECPAHQPGGPE